MSSSLRPKDSCLPSYTVPDLEDFAISLSWVKLIMFCRENLEHGQLCVKIVNAEPTDLVDDYTKRRIRFDKGDDHPKLFSISK